MMSNTALDLMVEIELPTPGDFLKIKETLSRIGVSSSEGKRLYPSAVILHKKGRYYLSHFKLCFMLDGKDATIDSIDMERQYTIAKLLEDWGLCKILTHREACETYCDPKCVRIIPFREKSDWEIVHKYVLGSYKHVD